MMSQEHAVRVERQDGIAQLMLNDVGTRNSLSRKLIQRLQDAILAAGEDPTVRAITLNHRGPTFCSGHNLRELQELDRANAERLFRASADLMLAIRCAPVPVIAVLEGGAIGAGCQLALSCDGIVATSAAYFQTPGGSKGWFCFTPSVPLLSTLPIALRTELLMGGEQLTAERAYQLGLVNRVVSGAELATQGQQFARSLGKGDREMVRLGKELHLAAVIAQEEHLYREAVPRMVETLFTESAQQRIAGAATRPV